MASLAGPIGRLDGEGCGRPIAVWWQQIGGGAGERGERLSPHQVSRTEETALATVFGRVLHRLQPLRIP